MMRTRLNSRVISVALLATGLGISALAQDDTRPLGDVARKTRTETKDRASTKHVLNDDAIAAKGERWSVSACRTIPCADLSIRLPAGATYTHGAQYPELKVERAGKTHSLKLLAGNQLPATDLEQAKWVLLEDWFTRPYYFGTAAKIEFDETTSIDNWPAVITHFTLAGRVMNYRGLALFAAVPAGTFGYACMFPEEDAGDGTNICEEILNSASVRMPEKYKYYRPNNPNDDP